MKKFFTIEDLANEYGYSKSRIRQLTKSGFFPGTKKGGKWVFYFEDMEKWKKKLWVEVFNLTGIML